MTDADDVIKPHVDRRRGVLLLALGGVAVTAPLVSQVWGVPIVGLALFLAGIVELSRARELDAANPASGGGVFSMIAGAVVFLQPAFVFSGLITAVSLVIGADGLVKIGRAFSRQVRGDRAWNIVNGVTNATLALVIWSLRDSLGPRGFGALLGLRVAAAGWRLLFSPRAAADGDREDLENAHPDAALGLPPSPLIGGVHRRALAEMATRGSADTWWSGIFIVTFFAIHVGRLDAEWSWLGMISPVVATIGDVAAALLVAVAVVRPCTGVWRRSTRPFERQVWRRMVEVEGEGDATAAASPLGERMARAWAERRLGRFVRRDRESRTLSGAAWRSVRAGLPLVAILIAVNPIWGFSWYFNSENWASAVWQKITETRTDTWRMAMIDAEVARAGAVDPAAPGLFTIAPPGIDRAGDFSFLVVGDPGEGDPSQAALRDQLLFAARRDEVKFLVISSDVVYPSGEMKDYESNFYLPLKGVEKPVYAIPGNHDWFNALDGFAANLMRPESARAAIEARVEADLRLSSTTRRRIDDLLDQAADLRRRYRLPTAAQTAPFFEFHTDRFSLIAVDTGILRTVDERQMAWLRAALERSRGSTTMAILGHPLYAAGAYHGGDLRAVHDLLRAHGVKVVMAGDTHDFEYTREPGADGEPAHHFVNGGGGAYLSIGTALDWPAAPPVPDYAFYPRTDATTAKLDAETPPWKRPAWWWVQHFGAWPFSIEAMSAVFDFNHAPFFQSFMEVRVDRSAGLLRLWLYGVDGRLAWRDVQVGGAAMPAGAGPNDLIEWTVPLR